MRRDRSTPLTSWRATCFRPRSTKVGRHSGFSASSSLQLRQPAQQGRNRDLRLDPRQLGAEAEMDAAAEGQRPHIGTGDVEPVRPVGIDRRIAVGRTQQAQHAFAFRDFLAAEILDVLQRHPAGHLHRGIVTQKFLDRVGDQGRIGLEQRELVGIAMQRQQAVADQVDGGFVAGAEQQDDVGGQFLVGELAAVFLGLHQLRGQIVAGVLRPQLEQLLEIHLGHQVAGVALLDLVRRQRHRIEQAAAVARAGVKHLAMVLGDAEHVADDRDRQPKRKILDQVHVSLGDDARRSSGRRSPGCAAACPRPGAP